MRNAIIRIAILCFMAALATGVRADCEYGHDKGGEVAGTLLGAAVGGLIGSQIGHGTGNSIAIGAGVVAGGLIGNKIGREMTCKDRDYHYSTTQNTLEYKETGSKAAWVNPDSGHSGSVTPTKTYIAADGKPCRDFTQSVYADGKEETINATACRQEDGTWQIVDS